MANKHQKAIAVLLLLFSLLCGKEVWADDGYYFKQLSLNEGLTQSTVRCILSDRNGFVWIGTRYGLNRYDRYSLKGYVYKKDDPASIPGNQINFLLEDKAGNIWVGTENGLARYHSGKDNFEAIIVNNQPLMVRSAIQLAGTVLFGGEGRLYEYSLSTKELKEVAIVNAPKIPEMFTGMKPWLNGSVLVYTRRSGVYIYNPTHRSLKLLPFIKDQEIIALYVNVAKEILVSPYGQGIKAYDRSGKQLYHYTTGNSQLSNDVVLDLLERDNKLWLATDGGGINMLDPRSGKISVLKHIPGNAASFPENSILTLYQDLEDNLWAGSIRGGIIAIRKAFINTYKDAPLNSVYGLSEKTALSLYEEKSGILWIGTDGGGINRYDPKTRMFKHYPSTFGYKVASVTRFNDQELLISAFARGLYLFNTVSGALRPFNSLTGNPYLEPIKSSGLAVNIDKVSDDHIYLFANKVFRYHIPTQQLVEASHNLLPNTYNSLLRIAGNKDYTYLFGSYGLFELNHQQNRLDVVFKLPVNGNPITAAAKDKRGVYWIGNRDGLFYYDASKRVLRKIKTGLFNEVSTLVADSVGRLWIGAQNMLFTYLIQEDKFVAFGESDGVVPNEFLFKPSLAARNGDIYLGGIKGLLHIKKDIPSIVEDDPVIRLINLELNGVSLPVSRDSTINQISIPWNHTSLKISVIAREIDIFRKKMFRYKISGLNERIVETYDHSLTIGSLPIGQYKILVSCGSKDGGWSKFSEVLSVSVNPPWYKRNWFIGLVVLALAGTIVLLYRSAIAKRERKLQWEMKEHEQRTYEAKIRFLIHISHELRTPLTLIYSPLRRMLSNSHLSEELGKKLKSMYKQANRMKEVIDMVLDMRKIELGQDRLKLQKRALNGWIRDVADNFSSELEDRGLQLVYQLDEAIAEVVFDDKKCELVLSNLLANALKFSKPDGSLTVSSHLMKHYVRVEVMDEGIGLDNVDTDQLFKPFYQGEHQQHGSGIGLSFSKLLIEMHGGRIGAETNDKNGATFYFELPTDLELVEETEPGISTALDFNSSADQLTEQASTDSHFPTTGYSVLIVEDEPELRSFLADSLRPYFKHVFEAGDSLTALSLAEVNPIDIIISDVMMPGPDGFELCRRIKEDIRISHIPIVLLTTRGDAESRNLGYKLGADAYIAKPFELDVLQMRLENLLKNREAVKSRFRNSGLFIPAADATFSSADETFMNKLNELIAENLENEQLHVEFLVDKMNMSRATLYSKLKSIAEIGVNDYINKFRLERAVYLLINTDKPIMEISDSVGFTNQRYFSTVFKQYYHTTPSLYRKRHKR